MIKDVLEFTSLIIINFKFINSFTLIYIHSNYIYIMKNVMSVKKHNSTI